MWVEITKTGKYKYVERYTDYVTGKKKRVSVTLEKNTAQAKKLAQKTLDKMIAERSALDDHEQITLRTLADAYNVAQQESTKQSTHMRNKRVVNTVIACIGEDALVERLTARHVRERLLSTGKSSTTLNEYLMRFRAMIRWGYRNDMVQNISFIDKIENFRDTPHRAKIQDKFLEAEELRSLLDGMDIELWRQVTKFLALSGLRFGELAALQKVDVDFNEKLLHVTKTYDILNNITTTTKTLCSCRDVFMQPELIACCHKLNELMLRQKLRNGIRDTHGLFLFDTSGNNVRYEAYNKYLKDRSKKILGKVCTTHVMRHTHASLLLEQGVPVDTISRRLGHEDSKVTREIYLHVTEKLKEKDNEQIARCQLF